MAVSVGVTFDSEQWNAALGRLNTFWEDIGYLSNDRKKVIGIIQVGVFQDVIQHFKDQQGPNGPWEAWSKTYADHMNKIGKSGNLLLQDTGALRNANNAGNASSGYRRVENDFLFFNSAQTKSGFPYAYAHDNDEAPRTQLPQRKFMWISSQKLSDIADAVGRCMAGIAKNKED